jgi:hypothetical protein
LTAPRRPATIDRALSPPPSFTPEESPPMTVLSLATALLLAGPAPAAADEGFTPLFNGKDLSGWVQPAADSGATFAVEDGEIVGRTNGMLKKNEFLATEKPYGDFVLKAKVKYKSGNSGIQFRSTREPNGRVTGPQADVADGFWGLFYEEGRRGILEQHKEAASLVKEGDWNEFVIEAKGDHVVVAINGTKVIDRTDPKFDKSGIIALQVHVGGPMEVRYKDIEIKTLD